VKIGYVINRIIKFVADTHLHNIKVRIFWENVCTLLLQTAFSERERGFKIKVQFKNRPLVHLEDQSVSCISADMVDYFTFKRSLFSMATRRNLIV
jgi:hypothetical protein